MCKWIPVKHSYVCGADAIVSDLPKDGVFSNTKPVDCPLKKEVDHGSN